ncbi:MAG TPA: tetratricopeptide repeat protein [Gammaproteobacteria bacterium]|nr:tetratricopeptide repeat protein [Gammaproteobacteria bacterium]
MKSERKVLIEQHKRFSQSALWRLQREYFDKEGINAWVNQVPFYITSNPFIANCYAHLVLGFMRDWINKNPDSIKNPFYIMELGTGSGRFSYYFVKTLKKILEDIGMNEVKFCYVMSDFTKHNMQYWEAHPSLKPFVETGLIDFAMYDMEAERPITLVKQNIRLNPEVLANPLTVFANYIFDTISHDSFAVHEGKLYELLLSLSTDEKNMENNRPIDMEKIAVDYSVHEIKNAYYGDPHLDSILELYKKSLTETSFLFPAGSFHAIKFLKKLSNNKLFIVSTDKGYSTVESLDHLGHPSISFHGSFSMMVNFHAIGEYFKNSGGDSFLQTSRKGIKTSVFSSGFHFSDMPETRVAIEDWVEGFSPSDYFTLHRRMSDSFQECALETIASHMQLALWDPHIYLKLTNRVTSLINESDSDTINFMATNMPKMAENYYHMPKTECILFEIGVFFHAIKRYPDAEKYYKLAQPYVGEQFGLYYNLALCQHHNGDNESALKNFKHALSLDNNSKETEEWISYLEKPSSEKPANLE